MEDLEPGDIGFGPIGGVVGFFVGLGQLVLRDESRFRHVFVIVDDPSLAPPVAVEAMPSGARLVSVAERWNESHVFVRLAGYPAEQRVQVAVHALAMVGTPYGFSDYLALALKRLGLRTPLLDRWISRTNHMGYPARAICSQLADFAMTRAGIKVFRDGRLSQNVIPGALFYQLLRIGGVDMWPDPEPSLGKEEGTPA
jgi:hypothetical protein